MQVFLGGTAGNSTWRKDVSIPILEAEGVTYYNPQLGVGEWTPAHQQIEAAEKDKAAAWLFVVSEETRGAASLVEAAYRLGQGLPIALVIRMIPSECEMDGQPMSKTEIKDLNRGRLYLKEVAEIQGVQVFEDVAAATKYAVRLVSGD